MTIKKFAVLLFIGSILTSALAETENEVAARNLFLYLTKPIPNLRIVATIEKHEIAWTDNQIQNFLADHVPKQEDPSTPEGKEKYERLMQFRAAALKKAHSGTNVIEVCEWIGPKLYRKDELGYAMDYTNNSFNLSTNFFKGGKHVQYTTVDIYDPTFSDVISWTANPRNMSVAISKAGQHYATENLWEAIVAEPELAIGFLINVIDEKNIPVARLKQGGMWPNGSFSVLRNSLSETKLKQLAAGEMASCHFNVGRTNFNGLEIRVITLGLSPSSDESISYYMDWPNQQKLFKVIVKSAKNKMETTFTRSDFDSNGVPRKWVQEGSGINGDIYKKVSVLEAEINPAWDLKEVFAPSFSEEFEIEDVTTGIGKIIQWPKGKPAPSIIINPIGHDLSNRSGNYDFIIRAIIFIVFFLPPLVMLFLAIKKRISK